MGAIAILGFFIILVGIPCVAIVAVIRSRQSQQLREKALEVQGAQTAEQAAQHAARTEQLEARVRVLERIVTDKGFALSQEIESYATSGRTTGGRTKVQHGLAQRPFSGGG